MYGRTGRGGGCGLRPASFAGFADVAPADGGLERLPERLGDAVAATGGQLGLPAGELAAHPLEVAQRHVAERAVA